MADPLDPVVLLGRGGSGTRMLSQLAVNAGVFIGNELNRSGDSLEWVEDLYALAIESIAHGVEAGTPRDREWCERLHATARDVLSRAGRGPGALWGWKLPETLLGLPQVMRAFPGARLVHLVRHPVSSSLRRSHLSSRLDNPIGTVALPAAYRAAGLEPAQISEDEVYVRNAVSWSCQIGLALDALAGAGDRVLQLRYEDCCADPSATLAHLASFLGTKIVSPATVNVDPGRTGSEAGFEEAVDRVWSICTENAIRVGYRPPVE